MANFRTVIGPPGTGKTTNLSREVQQAIDNGVDPQGIYMMSFTKAAAQEIAAKVDAGALGRVSTLHSLCFNLLKMHPNSMMGFKHLHEFAKSVGMTMYGIRGDALMGVQEGDRCLAMLQYARSRMIKPKSVYKRIRHRPCSYKRFQTFCAAYDRYKKEKALWDFDDLLYTFLQLPDSQIPDLDTLFIDEAQDLSPLQWTVVERLATKAREVIITGDPDQALYEWGGADPLRMIKIADSIKVLGQSYRVPINIHKIASRVALQMEDRYDYDYQPLQKQGLWTYVSDANLLKWDDRDTLVLVRINAQKKEYERLFMQNLIPYSMLGGRPSLFDSSRANAVRAIRAMKQDIGVTRVLIDGLRRHATRELSEVLKQCHGDNKEANKAMMHMVQDKNTWSLISRPRDPLEEYYFDNVDLDAKPNIRLSTIHASKGREAEHVMLHLSTTKRIRQSFYDLKDAEIRCWYVGVTRAKEQLTLVEGRDPLLPWPQIMMESR